MTLTEPYYYPENNLLAKAAIRRAFRFSPTVRCDEAAPPLAAAVQRLPGSTGTNVLRQRRVQEVPTKCTTVGISASDLRRNHETAPECERSLDRQSGNKLTGKAQKSGTARVRKTQSRP
jgi:hypothetical protein